MLFLTLTFFTLLVAIATLLPFSRQSHWVIRAMDFPRVQIACLAVVLLVCHFCFLTLQTSFDWVLIAVTTFCLAWQLWWILPYTMLWPKEVKQSPNVAFNQQISMVTANVLKTNRNSQLLINLVNKHQPDILVTLESDQWWEERLSVLSPDMPYSIKCPLDNFYGMHVFSKLPLLDEEIAFLVEDDVPSIHASLRLRTGDLVQLHFLHPAPPSPTENIYSKERDAELLLVAKQINADHPIIVMGDLNDVAWSRTTRLFRKISGLLDPRIGRGMFNTFNVNNRLLRWPLDHVFHSQHFTLTSIQRLPTIGSDHFALLTTLQHSTTPTANQTGLTANSEDDQNAQKMINKQDVGDVDVPK